MQILNYYTTGIANEMIKLKGTFAFWLTILGASFIPVIYLIYYVLKADGLIPEDGINPWDRFFKDQIMATASLLVPLFVVLITSLILQIEHKANGLKYLYALPIPRWSVYFSKLTVVILSIIFTYVLFFVMMLCTGTLAGLIHSRLGLLSTMPDIHHPIKLLFRSFVACLGIVGIQFWLSFRFKNFIIPLALGMVLVITGLVVFQAQEALYFPYAYNRLSLFALSSEGGVFHWFPQFTVYSLGYFILASVLGSINVRRMNV